MIGHQLHQKLRAIEKNTSILRIEIRNRIPVTLHVVVQENFGGNLLLSMSLLFLGIIITLLRNIKPDLQNSLQIIMLLFSTT